MHQTNAKTSGTHIRIEKTCQNMKIAILALVCVLKLARMASRDCIPLLSGLPGLPCFSLGDLGDIVIWVLRAADSNRGLPRLKHTWGE